MSGLKLPADYQYCPIPPSEQGLPSITAEYFHQISDQPFKHVEGLCFDRNGDLYFCSLYEGRVMKLDMNSKRVSEIFCDEGLMPAAVKIHKDGRLFVCSVGKTKLGGIIAMNPDGSNQRVIVSGQDVDDLVFDSQGGFYYTHLAGNVCDPVGGVYYVAPDYGSITPYIKNLAMANGVALSADEKTLWVTELTGGRLHRFPSLTGTGSPCVCYQFTGSLGPDSCSIDAEDNLYVAMFGQGRVMVFNPLGFPIGQILLPNRELGYSLCSSHAMVRPGARELYICAADDIGNEGAWIFKAESIAVGNGNAYQFA